MGITFNGDELAPRLQLGSVPYAIHAADGVPTGAVMSFEGEPQEFKIPGLRNLYQKIGMFGMPDFPTLPGDNTHRGPQVRGFGFLHDGVIDTLDSFFTSIAFTLSSQDRKDLEAFMLVFDTDLAPIVGQQVTLRPGSGTDSVDRAALLYLRSQEFLPRWGRAFPASAIS